MSERCALWVHVFLNSDLLKLKLYIKNQTYTKLFKYYILDTFPKHLLMLQGFIREEEKILG